MFPKFFVTNGRNRGWLTWVLFIGRNSNELFLIFYFPLKWEKKNYLSSLPSDDGIWVWRNMLLSSLNRLSMIQLWLPSLGKQWVVSLCQLCLTWFSKSVVHYVDKETYISQLMIHGQNIEEEKLKKTERESKRARTNNGD